MKMLPINTASSFQPRRSAQHRRQQSLEAPLLATPGQTAHATTGQTTHRRGLSLDQSMSTVSVPTGSRPLPQDTNIQPSGPLARTTQLDTNTGFPLDQQHYIKQVTQQHSLAQPGLPASLPLQAPNFQTHVNQQLNGMLANAPCSEQAAAMQDLQNHMMWYQQNFANTTANTNNIPGVAFDQINVNTAGSDSTLSMAGNSSRKASHSHSNTVPNTPQTFIQCWSSPPSAHAKPRSQSFRSDRVPQGQLLTPSVSFSTESFTVTTDSDYAASVYSSSVADPSSPPQQHNTPLPTLFEEACTPLPAGRPLIFGEPLLMPTGMGSEPDFNHPNFLIGGAHAVCQEQAALDAAGIEADYIDPGISDDELFSYLNQPISKNDPFTCKFEGCDARINRKENARSHVQNHLNIRPWHCRLCDKSFCRMHDTKRHHLTHTQERPAICPCGKTFARADALTRHRQRDMCEGVLPGFEKLEKDKPKRGRPKKDRSLESPSPRKSTRLDMETRLHKAQLARAIDKANSQKRQRSRYGSDSSEISDRSLPNTPPQDSDAMDTDDFLTMHDGDAQYTNPIVGHAWLDTPPTSPPYMNTSKTGSKEDKLWIDLLSLQNNQGMDPLQAPQSHPNSPSATDTKSQHTFDWPSSPIGVAEHAQSDHLADALPDTGFGGASSPLSSAADLFSDATNPHDFDVLSADPSVVNTTDVFSPPGDSNSGSSVYNSDVEPLSSAASPVKATTTLNMPRNPCDAQTHGGLPSQPDFDDMTSSTAHAVFSSGMDDFLAANDNGDQYDEIRHFLDSWVN